MIVSIIGIGNVGKAMFTLLLHHPSIQQINIMDPSDVQEGTILDMLHMQALLTDKSILVNDEEAFSQSDYHFHCAGIQNKIGESRLSILEKNAELCETIFGNKNLKETSRIIVISNPLDIITHYTIKASQLPAQQVIGTGTLLDASRLNHYLGYKDLKAWVLGEHGDSQVAITSNLDKETPTLDKAIEDTRLAAISIRKTQDYTAFGVVECAYKIFEQWESSSSETLPLSIQTNDYYNDLLKLDQSICISLPVALNKKGYDILPWPFNQDELEQLKSSAQLLAKLIS